MTTQRPTAEEIVRLVAEKSSPSKWALVQLRAPKNGPSNSICCDGALVGGTSKNIWLTVRGEVIAYLAVASVVSVQ